MTPPCPPCLVDMRLTASRAHKMLPVTFDRHQRWMRSADISSTRTEDLPTMPPLLTRAPSVPNLSAASNSLRISLSSATIAFHCDGLAVLALDFSNDFLAAASLLA